MLHLKVFGLVEAIVPLASSACPTPLTKVRDDKHVQTYDFGALNERQRVRLAVPVLWQSPPC
jgi:hypothetical protein